MNPTVFARDPLKFFKWLWPSVVFYREQRAILQSIVENDETVVVAGNMLGVWPSFG